MVAKFYAGEGDEEAGEPNVSAVDAAKEPSLLGESQPEEVFLRLRVFLDSEGLASKHTYWPCSREQAGR